MHSPPRRRPLITLDLSLAAGVLASLAGLRCIRLVGILSASVAFATACKHSVRMRDHCSIDAPPLQAAMDDMSPIDQGIGLPPHSSRRHRSRRRRGRLACPSNLVLAALCCFFAAAFCHTSHAFSSPSFTRRRTISSPPSHVYNEDIYRPRRMQMSAVADVPAPSNSASRMTDFQRRMKGLVKGNGGVGGGRRTAGQRATDKPANIRTVETLEEYKELMDEERGKVIVVRFFATWCKACKAIQPSFYRMAALYPNAVFVEVPVTNHNANLHQGLEVPSLPYGHIYYPGAGLVEELKISKKYFHRLVKMVRWYDQGGCGLEEAVPPETEEKPKDI
ncbi:hypothetical protein ACHAXT_011916 [Thalassiosira profunda]